MEFLTSIIDFILHIDKHLDEIVTDYQTWTYVVLFFVIFAETGFVVTPFLPGDSLLFATGAIVASENNDLGLWLMWLVLFVAAVLGDWVNYHVGNYIGPKAFSGKYKWLKKEYLIKTQDFYRKHGGKTIIYARFVPIVRTFAPFVAGIGVMPYNKFASYNIVGGLLWVTSFLFLGYFFGNLPFVRNNFTYVIFAIILLSVAPAIIELIREKKRNGHSA